MKNMKKYILILAAVSMLSLYGCTGGENTAPETDTKTDSQSTSDQSAENTDSSDAAANDKKDTSADTAQASDTDDNKSNKKVKKNILTSIDTNGYNLVSQYEYDFDSDGKIDTLSILTTAQVVDGQVIADDGQNWMVTVNTQNGVYMLYDQYLQIGSIQLDIGELYDKETTNVIILTQTSGAGKSIIQYTYESGTFNEELVYSLSDYAAEGSNIVKTIEGKTF